jgi:hypothetical protein
MSTRKVIRYESNGIDMQIIKSIIAISLNKLLNLLTSTS